MKFFATYLKTENSRLRILYGSAIMLLLLSVLASIALGGTRISLTEALSALKNNVMSSDLRILLYVRLPRTAGCIVAGAALSVSGAIIQGVLANNLASPSIIGVNSGAALAVTVCSVLGIFGGWRLSLFAFIGAFTAVSLISLGAMRWGASRGTVILMGVALNSLLNAAGDAVVSFYPTVAVMTADFKIGDFSSVSYTKLVPVAISAALALTAVFICSSYLDVLRLGDNGASSLGVNVKKTRVLFLLLASVLAGGAVCIAGLLSFVGLLVPHTVRRLGVTGSRHLLPLCSLFGAGFVTLCDLLSRLIFAPYEVPVGIIMAFLGAPFFIVLLLRKAGDRYDKA